MSREKLTQTAVARALGINQANVHHYIAGKVKPPLEQMALWAKVLGLSREEKVQFNRRAWEVHSPPEMVELSKSMDARIVELNATVASLRRENAELLHVIREMEEGGRMPLT